MKKQSFTILIMVMIIILVGCGKKPLNDEQGEEKPVVSELDVEKGSDTPDADSNEFSETEQSQEIEDTVYDLEKYGEIETARQEFSPEENGELTYYFELEKFYAKDSVANASSVNDTLQAIYDKYKEQYLEVAEMFKYGNSEFEPLNSNIPYNQLHFLNVTYAGNDYISILYNDIEYMGGAHPYSRFDGITIDCKTGEEVFASHFLEKGDEEILEEISNTMGFDVIGTWDDIDFYLTESTIVFFYRVPNFWDDVVLNRKK